MPAPSWCWRSRRLTRRTARSETPAGTEVDVAEGENDRSDIVRLGDGKYPGGTAGIRVVTDRAVRTDAVSDRKAAHGHWLERVV